MCPRSPAPTFALRLGLLLVVGFTLTGLVAAGGAGAEPADRVTGSETPLVLENNTMEIDLAPSGDARWTITWRYNMPEDADQRQFQELAEEFERGETDEYQTLSWVENVSRQLDQERERDIQITNVDRSSTVRESEATGALQLSFTWENFGAVEDNQLSVADVLTTETHGLWLDGLSSDQELILRIPEGYGVFDANVDVRDGALRWNGPTRFEETDLQATFVGNTGSGTETPTPTPEEPGTGVVQLVFGGLLVVLVGAGVAVVVIRYRDRFAESLQTGSDDDPPGAAADQETAEPPDDSETPEEQSQEIDEELLSDEERVERLLEQNGGRMKQADIVDETDWSNAKVSQLLSSMEDQNRIDKLRIGRENLISFPNVDVTELESEE